MLYITWPGSWFVFDFLHPQVSAFRLVFQVSCLSAALFQFFSISYRCIPAQIRFTHDGKLTVIVIAKPPSIPFSSCLKSGCIKESGG